MYRLDDLGLGTEGTINVLFYVATASSGGLSERSRDHLVKVAAPYGSIAGSTKTRSYGGLKIGPATGSGNSIADESFAREINPNDETVYRRGRRRFLKDLDAEVDENDYTKKEPDRYNHYDEVEYEGDDHCYRPGYWSYASLQNCNSFHEIDVFGSVSSTLESRATTNTNNVTYLGRGYFRESYMVEDHASGVEHDAVLKINRLHEDRNFRLYDYSQTQMEALVMLQTHSSNRTMNGYGYCATSISVEVGYDIEDDIMVDYKWVSQKELDIYHEKHGFSPRNDKLLTPEKKLQIALAMAESVAELHGNREGEISTRRRCSRG